MADAVKKSAARGPRPLAAPSQKPRKCSICPSWIEPGSLYSYTCQRCWRILDTINFKAESRSAGQCPLPFHPTRTAHSRKAVPTMTYTSANLTGRAIERLSDPDWIADTREALARVEEAAAEKQHRDALVAMDDGPQMNLFAAGQPYPVFEAAPRTRSAAARAA
jgi:hypothetical protein